MLGCESIENLVVEKDLAHSTCKQVFHNKKYARAEAMFFEKCGPILKEINENFLGSGLGDKFSNK